MTWHLPTCRVPEVPDDDPRVVVVDSSSLASGDLVVTWRCRHCGREHVQVMDRD
jgi:hypothetical protein